MNERGICDRHSADRLKLGVNGANALNKHGMLCSDKVTKF
jgi:hypothetical protein